MNSAAAVLAVVGAVLWVAGARMVIKTRRTYFELRDAGKLQPQIGGKSPWWQRLVLGRKAGQLPAQVTNQALLAWIVIMPGIACLLLAWELGDF